MFVLVQEEERLQELQEKQRQQDEERKKKLELEKESTVQQSFILNRGKGQRPKLAFGLKSSAN